MGTNMDMDMAAEIAHADADKNEERDNDKEKEKDGDEEEEEEEEEATVKAGTQSVAQVAPLESTLAGASTAGEDAGTGTETETAKESGDLKVYSHRFHILASYVISYFLWSWWGTKTTILAPAFAKYHNVTNELNFDTFTGVDFIVQFSNVVVIISYPLAAYALDKYGLRAMILGNVFLAVAAWIWYFAFENFWVVILSRFVGGLFGPMVSAGILGVSNRWFPPEERAKAIAAGTMIGLLGAGAAVVIGPFFFKSDPWVVDLSLKSCKANKIDESLVEAYNAGNFTDCTTDGKSEDIINEARENFCCVREADIPTYNLVMAVLQTFACIYAILVIRNNPPTPPSYGGSEDKQFRGTWENFSRLFRIKQILWITITDMFVTGPPMVVFTSIARILPAEVAQYDIVVSGLGIGLALPAAAAVSHMLDKHRKYFHYTMSAYSIACGLWITATVSFMIGGLGGGVIVLLMLTAGLVLYLLWQISEYELKMEWSFDPEYHTEGSVASLDRITINLSAFIMTIAIPPERFAGGAIVTLWIGFVLLFVGTMWFATTPDKYDYKRYKYEQGHIRNRRLSATLLAPATY